MKILHTADLHLGRTFAGLSMEEDHAHILDRIVTALAVHEADVLIVAGDIFDRATPPISAVRQFNAFLARVRTETRAAVVLIAGNHDSADRIEAMSVLTDPGRALIRGTVAPAEPPLVVQGADGPVAISALPFAYEYAARAALGDETLDSPERILRAQIAAARAALPPGAHWVIVAHAFVTGGAASEAERPLARVGGAEMVPAQVFDGADYVALGHLHIPQAIGAPHIRYAGAPLAYGFDEAGQAKSLTLVTLTDGPPRIEALPLVPLRGVRVLHGRHADLCAAPPSHDFIRAVLTDEAPVIDAMKRLRDTFPNACELTYARDAGAPEAKALRAAPARRADPLALIGDFARQVRGAPLGEAERAVAARTLHALATEPEA